MTTDASPQPESSPPLRLSIVVPAYNEQKNLPRTIRELFSALDEASITCELIIVDDNSTDGTAEAVRSLMAERSEIRLLERTPPRGFGRAVREGLAAATGDVAVVVMADSSDDPSDVVAYYRKICEGYDCVFGSRFIRGSRVTDYPRGKLIVNRIVNKIVQWMFRCPFNDLTNAFKAYRTDVVRELGTLQSCHFNITLELALGMLVRRCRIAQIPISWTGRSWGASNLRLREMGRRYLATILRAYADKLLLSDDLLADRSASRAQREGLRIEPHEYER